MFFKFGASYSYTCVYTVRSLFVLLETNRKCVFHLMDFKL